MPFDFTFAVPVWILLVFYGFFLAFFTIYSLFNLYHLLRFGTSGVGLFLIMGGFIFGSGFLIALSFLILSRFDWTAASLISDYFQTEGMEFFPGF